MGISGGEYAAAFHKVISAQGRYAPVSKVETSRSLEFVLATG